MKLKNQWQINSLKWKINGYLAMLGIQPKNYSFSQKIISNDKAQDIIKDYIDNGKPAMIARYGSCEASAVASYLGNKYGCTNKINEIVIRDMSRNAGLFPGDENTVLKFGELMEQCSQNVDLIGFWPTYMQDFLVQHCCSSQTIVSELKALEPYYYDNPWSSALKGKKVVVIHPFKETIESQYKKRDQLFENKDILPEFNLRVVKAVQTIAYSKDNRFNDWFEALDYMYEETMKQDFDVAIIGCGAYGFPLASKIKDAGKIAIHMGGATQLLFAIKGSRWDNHPIISKLYNENWVRPSENEKPKLAKEIEDACYW